PDAKLCSECIFDRTDDQVPVLNLRFWAANPATHSNGCLPASTDADTVSIDGMQSITNHRHRLAHGQHRPRHRAAGDHMSDIEQADDRPATRRRKSLSEKQLAILEAIQRSVSTRGYPPSMREIGDAVGLASLSSVTHQLNQLE